MTWSEERCLETFWSYIDTASPTIWVAEKENDVVGFLMANLYAYHAAEGIFVNQEAFYVEPAYRGSRAASLLIKELLAWADIVGANEVIGGNDNEIASDRIARFLERFGFRRVGYTMRRV